MQQHVRRSRRAHAQKSSYDSRGRHGGFEHVGFEPLIEKINGAHRHELDLVVFVVARHALKAASDEKQLHQFTRIQGRRIRRHHTQDRLHEAAHGLHGFAELVVSLGVHARVPRNFPMGLAVIVHAPKIIPIGHWREGSIQRQNFQSMARQVQVANNLRTQQRHNVRAHGKLEARHDFFGARSAAQHMPALQHEHLLAGSSQIGSIDQAIVASANHDHVV